MATKGKINKNNEKKEWVLRYLEKRRELRAKSVDPKLSMEDRLEARNALQKLPRKSIPCRVRNRCEISGRPRAFIRKFKISRIALRDLASQGLLPGVTKASW